MLDYYYMNKKTRKSSVIVILGPTSSGKSEIAIKLAKKLNGEVISADSRQVYKDMNLGTGKVEGEWKKQKNRKFFVSEGIPHHLLDFRSPKGEYNISHFKKHCQKLIDEVTALGRVPIICGGTGFWISAIVDNVELPRVKPNKTLRDRLEKKTTEQLFEILRRKDPSRAKTIDQKNKIRIIRAIEIVQALGKTPELKKVENENYAFLQIGIDWPQKKLDQKIMTRLESRWTAGMLKEVKSLKEKHKLSWKKIQSFGLGYYWIPEFLLGRIDKETLKERVFRAERGYAKRQRTWFKRDERIIWENNIPAINLLVKKFLKKNK